MDDELIYLNGIDGVTGQYLTPPMTAAVAAAAARGTDRDRRLATWLARVRDMLSRPFLGLPIDVDPRDLSRAGWGVVFAADTPPEVRSALQPLVTRRRTHVPPDRCKILEYQPGEAMTGFLRRHGVYPGGVVPTKVPYYLLLVGDPSAIPFEFQCLLDVEYAVGRLAFDRHESYGCYAESVVQYETSNAAPNARELVYWGPRHPGDPATRLSADYLVTPLVQGVPDDGPGAEVAIGEALAYRTRCLLGQDATKANLAEILHAPGDADRPAMLFTASHGMGWPRGHASQRSDQGALLCQDWSGFGTVLPGHYLAASDVSDDARLHGLVAFVFACYGAGTPRHDPFLTDRGRGPKEVADLAFVSALPQRFLSHPRGAALAVLGHVERAWGFSIRPPGLGPQLAPFRNLVGRILGGEPVGHATKDFSERYAVLSADLLDKLDETRPAPRPGDEELAWIWIERNDARNYVVLGDPAVKLRADLLR